MINRHQVSVDNHLVLDILQSLMRLLFRLTVQRLDGVEDAQPNADGVLPGLIEDAGFTEVRERDRVHTATGTIAIFTALRR